MIHVRESGYPKRREGRGSKMKTFEKYNTDISILFFRVANKLISYTSVNLSWELRYQGRVSEIQHGYLMSGFHDY